MTPGPRERLLGGTITLVREHGVAGTGLTELLERSRTARGSIYQHFPGGKTELVHAATLAAGRWVTRRITQTSALYSTTAVLTAIIDTTKSTIKNEKFNLGCPIVAAAVSDEASIRKAAASVFAEWRNALSEVMTTSGVPAEHADSFADFAISAIEGALIQARAAGSNEPMDNAATYLNALADTVSRSS